MNPLGSADIIFKDEGVFWTIKAQTPAALTFMRRTGLISALQPQTKMRNTTHSNTANNVPRPNNATAPANTNQSQPAPHGTGAANVTPHNNNAPRPPVHQSAPRPENSMTARSTAHSSPPQASREVARPPAHQNQPAPHASQPPQHQAAPHASQPPAQHQAAPHQSAPPPSGKSKEPHG